MSRVLVVVPIPQLDEVGVANRAAQRESVRLDPELDVDYRPIKAGPAWGDSYHDWLLGDLGCFEAAATAQDEGYDAVVIDTMTDSGLDALRSVLDIPVIGPARASYLTALLLGHRFSVLTQWEPWHGIYEKSLQAYGLADRCASIRSIGMPPDLRNLLGGKEEVVFPRLLAEAERCVEDGAHVICLGSTTMHQAAAWLAERLPVPVVNPGPLTYKLAEAMIALRLTHSRAAYRTPLVPKRELVRAMLDAGAAFEAAT
ncbi:MAG: aspartate/glutamate racemase family protein [Thermoleophilia bacterium]